MASSLFLGPVTSRLLHSLCRCKSTGVRLRPVTKSARHEPVHDGLLAKVQTLESFQSVYSRLGSRILSSDIAAPLSKLASLMAAGGRQPQASDQLLASLLNDIRSLLDDRTWTNHAADGPAEALIASKPPKKPTWRSRLNTRELSRLAAYLVQFRLHDTALLGLIAQHLLPSVGRLQSFDTARVLWAYSHAGAPPPSELLTALAGHIPSQVPYMDVRTIADVATHLVRLGIATEALTTALAARLIAVQSSKTGFDDFATALTAFAAAGLRASSAVALTGTGYSMSTADGEDKLVQHVLSSVGRATAESFSRVAKALSTMGFMTPGQDKSTDRLWGAIERRSLQLLPAMAPTDLSYIAAAFARASRNLSRRATQHQAAQASAADVIRDKVIPYEEDAGDIIIGSQATVCRPSFWTGLRAACTARIAEFRLLDLSHTAWSFAEVSMLNGAFASAIAAQVSHELLHNSLSGYSQREMGRIVANLMYSFAASGHLSFHAKAFSQLTALIAKAILDSVGLDIPVPTSQAIQPEDYSLMLRCLAMSCGLMSGVGTGSGQTESNLASALYQLLVSMAVRTNTLQDGELAIVSVATARGLLACYVRCLSQWDQLQDWITGTIAISGSSASSDKATVYDAIQRLHKLLEVRGVTRV